METAFDATGFEIPNEHAFQEMAADVGRRGEASRLSRADGVLHARCLKFGAGLEIWMQFYESVKGEVVYRHCRPAFRARHAQRISPWILTESDRDGESLVHGFIEDTNVDVLFQLQNLTEVGPDLLERPTLAVGLCGLAYRAEIVDGARAKRNAPDERAPVRAAGDNDRRVAGRILAFETLCNPQSGCELFWINVGADELRLEILVSRRALRGPAPRVGAFVDADVWLQGHILDEPPRRAGYEGVDWGSAPADFWKHLRKPN